MLQKPGGGGSKARAAARQTSSSSRHKNKSPDDIVRELQRVPTNKKCADCFAKLPQSVNLSFGTFLCLVCAGIHREFSHRIKGIGHSSFTIEEATNLSNLEVAGNEAVNKKYLANYKEAYESLKQPPPSDSSNDQMKLRYWIRKKYIEQAWIDKELSNASASNASTSDASSKKTKKKKKKDTNVVTKVVEPVAEVDLFSDDALFGSTPAPAPAAQQTFADFGAISVSTPVPPAPTTAAPPPPETATTLAFNADFGNFSSTPAVAAPPASAPPPPAAIDPFSANFPPTSAPPLPTTSTDPFANPPNSAAPPPPPESSSFNADFGNFDSAPTPTQQQEQASFQPESNTGMLSSPPQQNAKSKYDAFDELSMPAPTQPDHPPTQQQPTNDSTNNTQNITTSPKHQYMYSMISNLNVEQLNILKEVIDYRMNQMNSHQQQHMTMNNNVAPPSAPVPKQDQRFASLVDFSASSAVAPPPMSAPPPPTAPPPPPPPTNLLF